MRWPDGFMWGTGASSTQCEGAAPASDWWHWERDGHAPISGDGNGFGTRYAEDFALRDAGLGLAHHRLSIEWARVEPAHGVHDDRAVAQYRDMLHAARDAGIVPWVCLHHFTLPRWFADDGGFLVEANRTEAWTRHVDYVAETFGDLVGGWQPVNETNYYARAAYRGGWPPGHDDPREVAAVDEAIHLATAEAGQRLRQTGAPVSSIFGLSPIVVHDDSAASARMAEKLFAVYWAPGLGLFRDGVLQVRAREPVERPDLAGAFDLIGFSYYAAMGVAGGRLAIHPESAPVSALGYGIWADGVGLVLDRLHAEVPGTPLLVAEFGVGTDDDEMRARYLGRGLEVINGAIDRGVDVRGCFHWTGVDNYEWLHGFDVAFGIVDRERNVKASASVLRREARP